MTKITLSNVGSLIDSTTAANTINANSAVIQTAFDNTLSRNGTSPNQMAASIDMNSNRILNLPTPASPSEAARLQDVTGGTIIIPVIAAGTNIAVTGTNPVTVSTVTTPTFTTVNGNTITTGTGTLTFAGLGKSLTINNSLTLTGTDGTNQTFQASDTIVGRTTTDTLTNKTLSLPTIALGTTAISTGQIGNPGGNLTWFDGTSSRTIVGDTTTQTLSNKTLVAPLLGTPTSGVLTNCTGTAAGLTAGTVTTNANLTGAVTSVGNAASLGSFSSAALATALTDESGSGVVPFQQTGTWTPTDQSGAALTFTAVNCAYTKIGNIVHAYGTFTYPSTASGAAALIGGLPFTTANSSYAASGSAVSMSTGVNAGVTTRPVANSTNFNFFSNNTGANTLNSVLTLSIMTVNITYPVS